MAHQKPHLPLTWWGIGVFLLILFNLVMAPGAWATPQFFQQIPEGYSQSCNLCHTQPPLLNEFGQAFKANGYKFAGLTGPGAGPDEAAQAGEPGKGALVGKEGSAEKKQPPRVELILPASVRRGEKTQLQARVTAGGRPVPGQEVQFFEKTDLFREDKMLLGEATTGEDGVAGIGYWPRATGETTVIVARVATGGDLPPAEAAGSLAVVRGGPLVRPVEGLEIPFLGAWVVLVLVAAVWGTYAYVAYSALRLARAGRAVEEKAAPEVALVKEEQKYASL